MSCGVFHEPSQENASGRGYAYYKVKRQSPYRSISYKFSKIFTHISNIHFFSQRSIYG
jgi:hypothetical protein